jgi:hypothetical protein
MAGPQSSPVTSSGRQDPDRLTPVEPVARPDFPAGPAGRVAPERSWLGTLRRFLVFIAAANLVWEFAQLPLYTLWYEGSPGEIIFAAVHCTGGDILIASASLLLALLIAARPAWPHEAYRRVAALTIALAFAYTVFSEWLNTEIRGSWAYSDLMPVVPVLEAGLSPLAQWIVIPLAAFWWARPTLKASS